MQQETYIIQKKKNLKLSVKEHSIFWSESGISTHTTQPIFTQLSD